MAALSRGCKPRIIYLNPKHRFLSCNRKTLRAEIEAQTSVIKEPEHGSVTSAYLRSKHSREITSKVHQVIHNSRIRSHSGIKTKSLFDLLLIMYMLI